MVSELPIWSLNTGETASSPYVRLRSHAWSCNSNLERWSLVTVAKYVPESKDVVVCMYAMTFTVTTRTVNWLLAVK